MSKWIHIAPIVDTAAAAGVAVRKVVAVSLVQYRAPLDEDLGCYWTEASIGHPRLNRIVVCAPRRAGCGIIVDDG